MNEVKVKVLLVQAKNKYLIKEKKSKQKGKRSKFYKINKIISSYGHCTIIRQILLKQL